MGTVIKADDERQKLVEKYIFKEILQYALDKDLVVLSKKKGKYVVNEKKEK